MINGRNLFFMKFFNYKRKRRDEHRAGCANATDGKGNPSNGVHSVRVPMILGKNSSSSELINIPIMHMIISKTMKICLKIQGGIYVHSTAITNSAIRCIVAGQN